MYCSRFRRVQPRPGVVSGRVLDVDRFWRIPGAAIASVAQSIWAKDDKYP
jgi:hypothetical protein